MTRTRVEGLSASNDALGALPKALGRATLVRFGKHRLEPMRDAARENAPVADGDLRDSLTISTQQSGGRQRARFTDKATVEIYMGPTSEGYPQAIPQEFGSPNNEPVGYMRRAWDQHAGGLLTDLAEDLGRTMSSVAARRERKLARQRAARETV